MDEKAKLPATLEAVSQFTQSLESKLTNLDLETRTLIVLAIQELLVNIVEHAFADESGTIDVEFSFSDKDIEATIRDDAKKAFDMPDDITLADPLDLSEGGMGLFIIYQTFDVVNYERSTNGNLWQLTKRLG